MNLVIRNLNSLFFLLLAAFPLMLPNFNSITIILCSLFTIINIIKSKEKIFFNKSLFIYTGVFWMFLFYEIFCGDFNIEKVLLHLPFLVLPLLFYYKPSNLTSNILEKSIIIFQISVLLQCIIYLYIFLSSNNISQIFFIDNYNIPFFRTFVYENSLIPIHPTYFSAFLLVSFTFSLFFNYNLIKKVKLYSLLNILITTFFIFAFISKIIFLTFILTTLIYLVYRLIKKRKKYFKIFTLSFLALITSIAFSFNGLIKERFNEIKTEINRPLKGDYHNSINIRVAIIKCSLKLLDKAPVFGYGNDLQKELNGCFSNNYDSNFHQLHTYNTHNYYFNLLLFGGFFFLLLFLCFISFLLIKFKTSILYVMFVVQILLINFTENFFSRHYGIVLFMYFISLFLFFKKRDTIHQ